MDDRKNVVLAWLSLSERLARIDAPSLGLGLGEDFALNFKPCAGHCRRDFQERSVFLGFFGFHHFSRISSISLGFREFRLRRFSVQLVSAGQLFLSFQFCGIFGGPLQKVVDGLPRLLITFG